MTAEDRADVYTRITSEIIAAIEAGAGDWRMPWHHDGSSIARPANVTSGKAYHGVNTLALWIAAQAHGYGSGIWGTYRQWQALDAQVRKGERATTAVLWKEITARDDDDADGDDNPRFVCSRAPSPSSIVPRSTATNLPLLGPAGTERIPHAEAFITALGIPVTLTPTLRTIASTSTASLCHHFGAFDDAVAFIGTYAHEAAHATGAKHRLDRDFSQRFSPSPGRRGTDSRAYGRLRPCRSWPRPSSAA